MGGLDPFTEQKNDILYKVYAVIDVGLSNTTSND